MGKSVIGLVIILTILSTVSLGGVAGSVCSDIDECQDYNKINHATTVIGESCTPIESESTYPTACGVDLNRNQFGPAKCINNIWQFFKDIKLLSKYNGPCNSATHSCVYSQQVASCELNCYNVKNTDGISAGTCAADYRLSAQAKYPFCSYTGASVYRNYQYDGDQVCYKESSVFCREALSLSGISASCIQCRDGFSKETQGINNPNAGLCVGKLGTTVGPVGPNDPNPCLSPLVYNPTTQKCEAPPNQQINARCGSAAGRTFTELSETIRDKETNELKPNSLLCALTNEIVSESFKTNSDGTGWIWRCPGINDGDPIDCMAPKISTLCGIAINDPHANLGENSEGLCASGSNFKANSFQTTSNGWTWICKDNNIESSCSALKIKEAVCGDENLDVGEQCDDGNQVSGDGCTYPGCQYEPVTPITGCPEGTNKCNDGTCSLDCGVTDTGNAQDSCSNSGNNGKQDSCQDNLLCSLTDGINGDGACCRPLRDGKCNPYCTKSDPDCPVEPNTECDFTAAFWSVDGSTVAGSVSEETRTVKMIIMGTNCQGKDIKFKIKEEVGGWIDRDVEEITGKKYGDAVSWNVEDISEDTQYYFQVILVEDDTEQIQSANLIVTPSGGGGEDCEGILTCSNYGTDQAKCGGDDCNAAAKTIDDPSKPNEIKCGGTKQVPGETGDCYYQKTCSCSFSGSCGNPSYEITIEGSGCSVPYPDGFGKCNTNQQIDGSCETGEDEELGLTWTGEWTWGEGNSFETEALCPRGAENCVEEILPGGSKVYHYDPDEKSIECRTGGSRTILCPSTISLPYFTLQNVAIVVAVIVLIYIILNKAKKRKSSKKRGK